jgi:hypothetical protein
MKYGDVTKLKIKKKRPRSPMVIEPEAKTDQGRTMPALSAKSSSEDGEYRPPLMIKRKIFEDDDPLFKDSDEIKQYLTPRLKPKKKKKKKKRGNGT